MRWFDILKLRMKINTLESKNAQYEKIIKENLFRAFIDELYKPKINRLEERIRLLETELGNYKRELEKGKKK